MLARALSSLLLLPGSGALAAPSQSAPRVIQIDRDDRRIGLSIKAANYDSEQLAAETAAYESIGRDELTSLGDILDEATK